MRIGIWGCGERTKRYLQYDYFADTDILFYIDSFYNGQFFYGKEVISPKELVDRIVEVDYVIVASRYCGEIIGLLWDLGIERDKFIFCEFIIESFYKQERSRIKSLFPKLYEDVRKRRVHLTYENESDDFDENKLIGSKQFNSIEYKMDYFRYRSFEFVGNEIIRNGTKGDIAELGVFRGVFSALISKKLPDKDIYLFDTFEGFDAKEAKKEKKLGRSNDEFEYVHTLTNEAIVATNMPNKQKCHFCKGFFPKTVTESISRLEFCFVSIDVDFEESILEGLRFFYPRLSCGGYIFVHDYNGPILKGVKKAIERYEAEIEKRMSKVPLADRAGTLVITKNE